MIKAILWDVDGTLLDFKKSERYGIMKGLEEIGVTCDAAMLARYSEINHSCWEAMERGEMTKQEVLIGRFQKFFEQEGIVCEDIERVNARYQARLGEVFFENENALQLIKDLQGRVKQFVVTNGTIEAQRNKLKYSGLGERMDGIFISDEIGVEKPGAGFFAPLFEMLPDIARDEILIVGDSLTSDMQGGNNVGIKCCWYNPRGEVNTKNLRIDYEIHSLSQVEGLI